MAVNGIQLKEEQVWQTRAGHLVKIYKSEDPDLPWIGVNEFSKEYVGYHNNGRWHVNPEFDTARDLIKLVKDVPMKENKQFNPQPGDKIICNNGEEFICCTLEFLRDEITGQIQSNLPILGYHKIENYESWQDWNEDGTTRCNDCAYGIREVIPQNSEVTDDKKEDSLYTVDEVFDAIFETTKHLQIEIPWDYIDDVKEHLSRKDDPQYLEFLRLKAIYE